MPSVLSVSFGTDVIFVASPVLFAPFLPIPREEGRRYFGHWYYEVGGCYTAIPSYDILRICTFVQKADIAIDCVFPVDFHRFLGPFSVAANCSVFAFVICSSDTSNGLPLSFTSIHGKICCRESSRKSLWVLGLV